jgi:hypothetical protein
VKQVVGPKFGGCPRLANQWRCRAFVGAAQITTGTPGSLLTEDKGLNLRLSRNFGKGWPLPKILSYRNLRQANRRRIAVLISDSSACVSKNLPATEEAPQSQQRLLHAMKLDSQR